MYGHLCQIKHADEIDTTNDSERFCMETGERAVSNERVDVHSQQIICGIGVWAVITDGNELFWQVSRYYSCDAHSSRSLFLLVLKK